MYQNIVSWSYAEMFPELPYWRIEGVAIYIWKWMFLTLKSGGGGFDREDGKDGFALKYAHWK